MRGVKIILRIISKGVLVLLALLVLMNMYIIIMRHAFGQKQPQVFGYSSAVVISGSMEPAICVDDMVIIHRQNSYELNDIIMYEDGQNMVTHRIVGIGDGAYITRGDSNNADDPAVSEERVVGKVVTVIPNIGKIISFLWSPLGMCILVLAVVFSLILSDIANKNIRRK